MSDNDDDGDGDLGNNKDANIYVVIVQCYSL